MDNSKTLYSCDKMYTLSDAKKLIEKEKRERAKAALMRFQQNLKKILVRLLGVFLIAACMLMAVSQQSSEDGTGFVLCALIGLIVALKPEFLIRREDNEK